MTNIIEISVEPEEKSIIDFLVDSLSSLPDTEIRVKDSELCIICGEHLYKEGHCSICLSCGYSKCNL